MSGIGSHHSARARTTEWLTPKSPPASPRRLNPKFVAWMMGFPPGWTSCGPTEMQSYLSRQRTHLRSLLEGRYLETTP